MAILDAIKAAAPEIAAQDAESARLGRLSDVAFKAITDTGLLRGLQPERWGTEEMRLSEFTECITELSRHSASAGWVSAVLGIHPWQLGLFDDRAQQEMWAEDPVRPHSSSYTPTGKMKKVDGGYRLSGRWSFSSGSDLCDAVVLGGIGGMIEVDGHKVPDVYSSILYRDQYVLEDTWDTAGLEGTGSKDVVVDDVFVPEHRTQSHTLYGFHYGEELPGWELNSGSLYRLPWSVVFTLILASASVGASQGFVDAWTSETRERQGKGGTAMRDDALMQWRLAEAVFAVDGAKRRIQGVAVEMQDMVERGHLPTLEERAYFRWLLARSAQDAGSAITELSRSASGRIAYKSHPLHRKFHDVTTGLGHAFLYADPIGTTYGGLALGSANFPAVPL